MQWTKFGKILNMNSQQDLHKNTWQLLFIPFLYLKFNMISLTYLISSPSADHGVSTKYPMLKILVFHLQQA